MDEAGGLYFAQARRYDAETGRFVSEDIVPGFMAAPHTMNRYSYCWNSPLILVDLNGLEPATTAEGHEAHTLLQNYLKQTIPGVEYEVAISGASVNGNDGRADIIYHHDGIVEIYEIKPGSHAPGAKYNAEGKAQLERYISHYIGSVEGTSLYPIIEMTMLPSAIHPDRMIRYYMYPATDPGMIYWGYVKKPQYMLEGEKAKKKARDIINKENLEKVAVGGIVILVIGGLVKWGIAAALAGPTGGGSLGVAICMP